MRLLSILVLLLLTVCWSCKMAKKTTAEPINVDYDILINEEFEVDFDSNPTTGYSWRWANSQAVEIVDSVGHSYVATPSQNETIDGVVITNSGSGGSEIWKFKGIKSGLDTIKMGYTRPWKPHDLADFKMIVVRVK